MNKRAIRTISILGTRTTVRTISVPVEFRNVPSGMELSGPSVS
jgi:hypothetical protein